MIDTSHGITSKQEKERNEFYNVFCTKEGIDFLWQMILDCRLLEQITTEQELVRRNYALVQLERGGLLDMDRIYNCLKGLLGQPPKETRQASREGESFPY